MIPPYPSVQDQSTQTETVIQATQRLPSEPGRFLAKPLEAIEGAIETLSGDPLKGTKESLDALLVASRKFCNVAKKNLNLSEPLAPLSLQERRRIRDETGRLIKSSDIDPEIPERFLRSQAEALLARAAIRVQQVASREIQYKARRAIKKDEEACHEVNLAKGKQENTERQERAIRARVETMKTVYGALEDIAGILERSVEPTKKYAETRGAQAEAIEALVAAQPKV